MTTDFKRRLVAITSHGLFRPIVRGLVAVECDRHRLSAAEQVALKQIAALTKIRGPEIFDSCPLDTVAMVLKSAAKNAVGKTSMAREDVDLDAILPYLKPALVWLAQEKSAPHGISKILDFMDSGRTDAFAWERQFREIYPTLSTANITFTIIKNGDLLAQKMPRASREQELLRFLLHPNKDDRLTKLVYTALWSIDRDTLDGRDLHLLAKLEEKNAVLLGRGMAYDDRKKILEAFALENRAVKLIKEATP